MTRPASHDRVAQDEATFFQLQRLEQGELQQLGDALLPWKFERLRDLKPNGLALEGKTRTGVPDSFVGPKAEECTAAVEYTSQKKSLARKLESDLAGVRNRCPLARDIFLCTNRQVDRSLASKLEASLGAGDVRVTVFDGVDLADALALDRQDLRERHLGIPIGAHSRESLMPAMERRLRKNLPPRIQTALERRAVPHHAASARVNVLASAPDTVAMLAVGAAGVGKSTWSARHALDRCDGQPTCWAEAKHLRLDSPDPLSTQLVQAAYGVPDIARVPELSELLRRERLRVLMVVDGIDEVRDFERLMLALREHRTSALGPYTILLLTCREEALAALEDHLAAWRPELLNAKDDGRGGTRISLGPLHDHEVEEFLQGEGATAEQTRLVLAALPAHLSGIPLFLLQALELVRKGEEIDPDRAIQSYADFAIKSVQDRLREDGRAPSLSAIGHALSEVALHAIASSTDDVSPERARELLGDYEGEATLPGRAAQAGLLEERADGSIGFQHPLYLEYFAALALQRDWRVPPLPELASEAGKQIARRVAPFLTSPAWLLERLLAADPAAACECAAFIDSIPAELQTSLVAAVEPALASRFHSDRYRAIHLLGKLRGDAGKAAATRWWNGLDVTDRRSFVEAAAEMFLALEIPEALSIILGHRAFLPAFPWYEPSFLSSTRRLDPAFRAALVGRARDELRKADLQEDSRDRLVALLAIFGDTSFIEVLRARAEAGAFLSPAQVRALIHANTEEAMYAYALGVENVHRIPLGDEPGYTLEEKQSSQNQRWSELVLRHADILMYPRDALITLAEDALSPSEPSPTLWFGFDLAPFLGDERLIVPYQNARRRLGRGYWNFGGDLVEQIIKRSSPAKLVELYANQCDDNIRQQIVHHAFNAPGRVTEDFLLERLKRGEHLHGAVQSLGFLRSHRAGEPILEVFRAEANLRHICARAIGMIGYAPAEATFCEARFRCRQVPLAACRWRPDRYAPARTTTR